MNYLDKFADFIYKSLASAKTTLAGCVAHGEKDKKEESINNEKIHRIRRLKPIYTEREFLPFNIASDIPNLLNIELDIKIKHLPIPYGVLKFIDIFQQPLIL